MFKNPYFSSLVYGTAMGSQMMNNVKREIINAHGYYVHYLPRLNNHIDFLFQESPIATFEVAIPLMGYPSLSQGYQGMGDILTKFSVRNDDSFTLEVSRTDFTSTVSPVMAEYFTSQNIDYTDRMNACSIERPREGDLIYSHFDKGLFFIKFVEWRKPFYPQNQTDIFSLSVERFEYSGERINIKINPIPELQNILQSTSYYRFGGTLKVGGVGTLNVGDTVYIHPNVNNITGNITAELMAFNIISKTFTVTLLSNYSPDSFDANKEHVWTQYNNWYISNQDMSVQWQINTMAEVDVPYQDNNQLQSAFDGIKVIDSNDANPYGFV